MTQALLHLAVLLVLPPLLLGVVNKTKAWFAGRAGLLGIYPYGGLAALRLGLEGLIPLTRPEFALDNVGPVHQPSAVIGRLSLGLEMSFP